jgi:hypothetical protein
MLKLSARLFYIRSMLIPIYHSLTFNLALSLLILCDCDLVVVCHFPISAEMMHDMHNIALKVHRTGETYIFLLPSSHHYAN